MMRTRPVPVNRLERASYDQSPPVDQLFDWVTGTGTGDFQKYVKKNLVLRNDYAGMG